MNMQPDLDPIAAICGEVQPKRTREERELDRLRDLLARDTWSGRPNRHGSMPWPENVCILAGINPEGIGDVREDAFPLLPGALAFYGFPNGDPRDPAGLRALGEGVREHVGFLLGLDLPTSRPRVAMEAAAEAGLMPPWLEIARGDAGCAALLPPAWLERSYAEKRERTPFQETQRRKANVRWEGEDWHKLIEGEGMKRLREIKESGFDGFLWDDGTVKVAEVAREMRAAINIVAGREEAAKFSQDNRPLQNRVRKVALAARFQTRRSRQIP